MTDEEMRTYVGGPTKGIQFILLGRVLYHPVDGGWEAYEEED